MDEGAQTGEVYEGMGATELVRPERIPYTVQKVISPNRIVVTADKRMSADGGESQSYEFESVPLVVHKDHLGCGNDAIRQTRDKSACKRFAANRTCEGCRWIMKRDLTNGLTLIKTKRGWKVLGQDRRFALGTRECCEDSTFRGRAVTNYEKYFGTPARAAKTTVQQYGTPARIAVDYRGREVADLPKSRYKAWLDEEEKR